MDEGSEHLVHMAGAYNNLINKIDALERHFTSAHVITAQDDENGIGVQRVWFGASPSMSTKILPTTLQLVLAHATETGKCGLIADPMEN